MTDGEDIRLKGNLPAMGLNSPFPRIHSREGETYDGELIR